MDRLEQFEKWANEGKRRRVSIEIKKGGFTGKNSTSIWVYDYLLSEGQYVNSVDEINLEKAKILREKAEYERLKAKYEGVQE